MSTFIFTTPTPRTVAIVLLAPSTVKDKEKLILMAHVFGPKLLEISHQAGTSRCPPCTPVDVAESGSKGEHLRDGRQSLLHSVQILGAFSLLTLLLSTPPVLPHHDWHERQILSMCWTCANACTYRASSQGRLSLDMTQNLRSLHQLRTVWIRLPDTSPSTTTQNRRPCATLSPAHQVKAKGREGLTAAHQAL